MMATPSNTSRPAAKARARTLSLASLLAAILAAACSPGLQRSDTTPRTEADTRSQHAYTNRHGPAVNPDGFWRWQWDRVRDGLPKPPEAVPANVTPQVAEIQARRSGVAVTWIGHASVLLQLDGLNILNDPIFSERASPVGFAGPKRAQPPGLRLDQLPRIDVVTISHNHYDHLDLPSVRALMQQAGGPPLFLVPAGVEQWFAKEVPGTQLSGAATNVRGLNWDATVSLPGRSAPVDFHFLAVQHWSSRTPWDRNETLWGSWAIVHPQFRYWFSGDLGYSQDTVEIGRRWGPFDLAAIAVGAYEPRWFMKAQHIDPTEAVQVMKDVGARQAIGMHWGTFELTDEPLDEPPKALARAVAAAGLGPERFTVLRHGETRVLKN